MTVLERLKLELNNKPYFSDDEFTIFLKENGLTASDDYKKSSMQKYLLLTVIDVFEAISNDVDIMKSISTSFANVGEAFHYIQTRIQSVKDKIASIPEAETTYNAFSLLFYNASSDKAHVTATKDDSGNKYEDKDDMEPIPNETIDKWFAEFQGKE